MYTRAPFAACAQLQVNYGFTNVTGGAMVPNITVNGTTHSTTTFAVPGRPEGEVSTVKIDGSG